MGAPLELNDACVYITHNSQGEYYIGKSTARQIANGYQGSGIKIMNKLKKHSGTFTTEVLFENLSTQEAYRIEGELVNAERLKDPLCLNLMRGGAFKPEGDIAYIKSRTTKQSITRLAKMKSDPEYKAMYKANLRKACDAWSKTQAEKPFIIDGVEHPISRDDFNKLKSKLAIERYSLKKVSKGNGSKVYVTVDKGWYFNEVRYSRLGLLKEASGVSFHRIAFVGSQAFVKPFAETKSIVVDDIEFKRASSAHEYVRKNKPNFELVKIAKATQANPGGVYELRKKVRKPYTRRKVSQKYAEVFAPS